MPNQIMTTGMLANVYNSRALITHNFDNASLVRTTDSKLWAVFRENYVSQQISIYYSDDEGFSWNKVWVGALTTNTNRRIGIAGLNTNGPHVTLQVFERLNRLIVWHAYYNISAVQYNIEPLVFDISDPSNVTKITTDSVTEVILDADAMAVDAPYNNRSIYVSYMYFNNLKIKQFRPTYQTAVEATVTHTGTYYNLFGTCAHQNGYCDYLLSGPTGTGANKIMHTRYDEASATFTSDHIVDVFGGAYDAYDLSIAHDNYNNLIATWSRLNAASTDIDVYYSLSKDSGVTWSAASVIPKTAGHSYFIDSITGEKSARSTILGGVGGFIVGYVRTVDAIPKTFVRTILTEDGVTYTLGAEKQIGTQVAKATDSVVGLRWFQPSASTLLNIAEPGQVRVAFQIGEGNSTVQNDSIPVRFCQELLITSAYPDDVFSYAIDVPSEDDLLVNVEVLGGVSENLDYYSEGLRGTITDRYVASFNKAGTSIILRRYEPNVYGQTNDRSAYDNPTEYVSLALIDPASYEAPLANRGSEGFTTFIERDIRKIFLPPSMHLARTFIINDGNFLKRTVWTAFFDGNEYEISQVVPYFIKQQIAYFSANMYVVGPSNNPFSKRVLPSET